MVVVFDYLYDIWFVVWCCVDGVVCFVVGLVGCLLVVFGDWFVLVDVLFD